MTTTKAVVVGAGASGLAAARLLAWRGAQVTVVDGSTAPGGEWNPYRVWVDGEAIECDRGIRIAMSSGDEALDDVLYRSLPIEWHRIIGFPNEAHVLRGKLWPANQCPDARALGAATLARGLDEMRRATPAARPANLKQHLDGTFGPTFTEAIYRPFLRKVYGRALEDLAPGAERYFIPARIIVDDDAGTERLHRDPALRTRVAHPSSRTIAPPGKSYFHPTEGSMGRWIEKGIDDLRDRGATLRFGRRVEAIHREGDRVLGITLDGGERIDADVFAWGGSVPAFLAGARLPMPSERPTFRDLTIVHLATSAQPLGGLHYASFYDPIHRSHRARFYAVGRPNATELERRMMSVEVVDDPADAHTDDAIAARVAQELRDHGLLPADSAVTWQAVERFPRVFPVLTPAIAAATRRCETDMARFTNVAHVGRTEGAAFLDVILRRCDTETARLLGETPISAQQRSAA